MKKKLLNPIKWGVVVLAVVFSVTACKDKKKTPEPITEEEGLEVHTARNIPGDPGNTNQYTFFSFRNNAVVPKSDSATTQWDIAFKSTTIIVNGGVSGPGSGAVHIYNGIFNEVQEAPESGYTTDTESGPAIVAMSGSGWYNYNSSSHVVSPIPGRVLVFKTAQGKYAKVEIISYYKDFPANPTMADESRYYTFRYMYQDDGSRTLK